MPENPSPGPGWKNQGAGKKDGSPIPAWKQEVGAQAPGGAHDWQNQKATAAPSGPRSRSRRLFVALGLLGTLVGGLVYVAMYWHPMPPGCLMVLGSSYHDNLAVPHNAYGWQGLTGLEKIAAETNFVTSWFAGASQMRLAYHPQEVKDKKSWEVLWNAAPKDFDESTVVLFLAFHGGADAGGPFLFLNDPRGQDKVYFKELLQDLKAKWSGKNVVLILEPAQIPAHWHSGMLGNDFVKKLKEMAKDIEAQEKLLVLCACDEEQISWPSEQWQRTIFSHYVIEGLKGAADGHNKQGRTNQRVSAGELFTYVHAKVPAWAQANRGAAQTPILLGSEDLHATELVQLKEAYAEAVPAAAPGRTFAVSADLKKAWTECETLRGQVPGPAVYTPHLWRVYRDALLRWEQLERAGVPTDKIASLKGRLRDLHTQIQRKARVNLEAREITRALPLPAVLGLSPYRHAKNDELLEKIKQLWTAKDEHRQSALQDMLSWAKVGAKQNDDKAKAFHAELCRQFLIFLATDQDVTSTDLRPAGKVGPCKARALARLFDDEFPFPRPAEMHYLVMLLEDLDPEAPSETADLKLALEVRVLAEEAALAAAPAGKVVHPYSEVVHGWIRDLIEGADEERRKGEDYLFGSTSADWDLARAHFKNAKDKYEGAGKVAAEISKAMELRDGVLADLPYQAQWLAQLRLSLRLDRRETTALVEELDKSAEGVGKLAWALDQARCPGKHFDKAGERSPQNPDRLSPKALLSRLVEQVKNSQTVLNEAMQNKWKDLKKVNQAQDWHDLEAALAVPLLDRADSRKDLLERSRKLSADLHDGSAALTEKDIDLKGLAEKQKLLSQAVLVKYAGDLEEFGKRWKNLPDEVTRALEASLKRKELKDAALDKELRSAELLCRLLPGGAVPSWKDLAFGPPEALRRLRWHDLLLWQAKRTETDHWYSESRAPADAYYVHAAKAYAQMAEDLAEAGSDTLLNRDRKRLAFDVGEKIKPNGLTAKALSNPNLTSEREFPLVWQLLADAGVPEGTPMAWLEVKGPLAKDKRTPQRKAVADLPAGGVSRPFTLLRPEKAADAPAEKSQATFHCLFRGQKIGDTLTLQLLRPHTIVNHFPPEKSGVAFRMAKDHDYGAVAFLLDCSGSMKYKMANKGQIGERFEFATEALEKALKKMPDNSHVSLMIFITRVDRGEPKFEFLRTTKRWKKEHLPGLMEKIKALEFNQGWSPIAEGMVKCATDNDAFPADFAGRRLVVALTDGDDNRSFGFKAADPPREGARAKHNKNVYDMLRKQFKDSDTELHVICFNGMKVVGADNPAAAKKAEEDAKEEARNAEEQFRDAVDTLKFQADADTLAKDLELAIRPRLHVRQQGEKKPAWEGTPLPLHRDPLQWRDVSPSTPLNVGVQKGKSQLVTAERGDFLILTLNRKGRGEAFERSSYAEEMHGRPPEEKVPFPWSAHMLRNNIDNREVNQLLCVERSITPQEEEQLQQQHPGFLWLEMKAKDRQPPGPLSWYREYNYPAPVWSVKRESWPTPDETVAVAETKVWWIPNQFPGDDAYSVEQPRAKTTKPHQVGSTHFTFEPAEEEHEVSVAPGKTATIKCLVVRVNHARNKPVIVLMRAANSRQIAQEHRFYGEEKYTALFWSYPANYTLQVVSLEDFKQAQTTFHARFVHRPNTAPGPEPIAPRK